MEELKTLNHILSKWLKKAYEMGVNRDKFSDMQSELDLPIIDMDYIPAVIEEISAITRPSQWIPADSPPKKDGLYSCLVKHTQNPEPRTYAFKNGQWQTPGTEVTFYMPIPPLP